jgi:hypothetical protein
MGFKLPGAVRFIEEGLTGGAGIGSVEMSFFAKRFATTAHSLFLLFGASATAFSADLPVAPEPIDYVRICDAYGARFFYIPGTETCLRIGGRIRVEYRFNRFGDSPNNWDDNLDTSTNFRARSYLYMDSRTQTEFGLLRLYSSILFNRNTGAATATTLEHAYVQYANFTFGRTQSLWDFWTGFSYGSHVTSYTDVKSNLAAYTAAFGNGVSASVSIEDPTRRQTNLVSPNTPAASTTGYGGARIPDFIGRFRIDQGWGSAQVMGALHQVLFADTNASNKLGWAIGGGVNLKVPVMNQQDRFALQITYADGANAFGLDSWDGRITDAINTGGSTRTTRSWNIGGGWRHHFTDVVEGNLEGNYNIADAATNAFDFSQWGIAGNLVWKPVDGLRIGGELQYRKVDYKAASGLNDRNEYYGTVRVQRTF